MIDLNLTTLIGGILTLGIFSFLYRDNKVYRFFASIIIGFTVGNSAVVGWSYLQRNILERIIGGNLLFIIPIVIGALFFSSFSKDVRYLNRIPTAILVGIGSGLTIRASVDYVIIGQTVDTMLPLITESGFMSSLNNIIIVVATFTCLMYFFFTREPTGILGLVNKTGRYFLMIAFGTTMANVALGRVTTLIQRTIYLFKDTSLWLLIIPASVIIAIDAYFISKKSLKKENEQ